MFRSLIAGLIIAVISASVAEAQCTGAGGVPFNCAAAGASLGAADLILGGKASGSNTVKFTGLQAATGMFAMVPTISGAGAGRYLGSDGNWTIPPGTGGGSTSPGGTSGQLQFNNAGSFGGLSVVPASQGGTGINNGSNTIQTSLPLVITGAGQQTFNFGNTGVPWTYNFPQATAVLAYQSGSFVSGHCIQASGTAGALSDSGAVCGSGGGSGTVTSVGMTVPSIMSVAGSPVTSSGTLAISLVTETANTIFAGPASGASAAPTFRAIVPADLPVATTGAFGAVKPDGTTIRISGGVISSVSGGGGVTWPASTDLIISNGTSSPAGLAPINGDCVVGSGGAWTAGACGGGGSSTVPVTTIATSGSSQALAFPAGGSNAYDITLTGNCTLTLTGGTAGQYQTTTLVIRAGAGGFSATPPSGILWPGGIAPVTSTVAGQITVLKISTSDGGTTKIGSY